MKPLILIADDEPDVLRLAGSSFASAGFEVIEALSGPAALEQARSKSPSLVVLDLLLPGLTGFEVLRALRSDRRTSNLPVILLSACADEANRILGLESGADDFVTKPFSARELMLRGRAILQRKRPASAAPESLVCGAISLDQDRHLAQVNGESLALTAIEFKLLTLLARNNGRVLPRDVVLDSIWGDDTDVDPRTVDTHVRRLRDKLGAARDQVQTVRSFGYRLDCGNSLHV